MLVCVYYCAFGTRDRGCQSAPGFPCALCFERANDFANLGQKHAAGTMVFIVVHWSAIAVVMLVPIILGWLSAWGLLAFRRRREPWGG